MPNVIYGLHEAGSTEVRYVGKTCQLAVRLKAHRQISSRGWNKLFYDWVCSVGASGQLCARVLEESPEDWRVAEITWIRRLRKQGHRLLNSAPGGSGGIQGAVVSEETCARISAALTGKKHSLEWRANMSAAMKGKKGKSHSLETRARMSEAKKGKLKSLETRARMSEARKQCWTRPEYRSLMHLLQCRPKLSARGKHLSIEHRRNISAAKKGKKYETILGQRRVRVLERGVS